MKFVRSVRALRSYLPAIGLTVAGFLFVTSELMPIGLLSDIASSLGVNEAKVGLLITAYAWFVALMSLPLMLLFAKMNHRKLLLLLLAAFALGHLCSWLACGFGTLMASRIVVAVAHSVFWSVVPAMVVSVYPGKNGPEALSLIATGESIAVVAGLPVGRTIGLLAGWRMAFGIIAVAAALLFILLWRVYPDDESGLSARSRKEMFASVLSSRPLRIIYMITALFITGHYTGYSYIEPFLLDAGRLPHGAVTWILCVFGLAGIGAAFWMSAGFAAYPRRSIIFFCLMLPAAMGLLSLTASAGMRVILPLCTLWGLCITSFNICFQNEVLRFSPDDPSIAMSLYSGIFNLGIGAGAMIGGSVALHWGIEYNGLLGASLAAVAASYCFIRYLPVR